MIFLWRWMNTFSFVDIVQWKDTPRRRWRSAAGCHCSEASGAAEWHLRTHGWLKHAVLQGKWCVGWMVKSTDTSLINSSGIPRQLTLSNEDRIFQVCWRRVVIVHLVCYKNNVPKKQMVSGYIRLQHSGLIEIETVIRCLESKYNNKNSMLGMSEWEGFPVPRQTTFILCWSSGSGTELRHSQESVFVSANMINCENQGMNFHFNMDCNWNSRLTHHARAVSVPTRSGNKTLLFMLYGAVQYRLLIALLGSAHMWVIH